MKVAVFLRVIRRWFCSLVLIKIALFLLMGLISFKSDNEMGDILIGTIFILRELLFPVNRRFT